MIFFFFFFFPILTFEEVGKFWQNDTRLFERAKLVLGCHLKAKYSEMLRQLRRDCEEPLPAICRLRCAATLHQAPAVKETTGRILFLFRGGHSTEPMAIRWQPQGGIVRSGPLEDGPQPQEAIHDLCWAGPRQSQSTVPDLPRALWPSSPPPPQKGRYPGRFFKGWLEEE